MRVTSPVVPDEALVGLGARGLAQVGRLHRVHLVATQRAVAVAVPAEELWHQPGQKINM